VVVTGMGKSGHIANKVAATLASTGTPAFYMHPGEASHGDLGMLSENDVLIAFSNSGETDEILTLLPILSRRNIAMIAITGKPESMLATRAMIHLNASVEEEACPLNLAPTASTTAALALGDALAVALLEIRGFTPEDFAMSHPGGSLGRRLLLTIGDLMRTGTQIPSVKTRTSLSEALVEITQKGLGMTAIQDNQQQLIGIFTDGDLRRTLDDEVDIHNTIIDDVMTREFICVSSEQRAAEAVEIMEQKKITALLVKDDDQLVGALNIHDLFKAGVM
ncbi:MAG: KpsF/GutQ family sugar-phosphate isomerase, partial [Gammaproteobacteria bacterium]|nr:KpsF/GutQ family sugar-phosphate isomerase [Gammaproteobacteria bacterium]